MNYRHIFHAGNFADAMKHAILVRILLYLALKPAGFRVIDTHAGEGAYQLARDEAARTGEWRNGVARLGAIDPASPAGLLLAPYRACVGPCDAEGRPAIYPGSPKLIQALLRAPDRAIFCETSAPARKALITATGHDGRIKCPAIDGWTALRAFVPPPERRGLVLVDPPFEAADEFARLAETVFEAWRKWPTGVFALWYPVKKPAAGRDLAADLAQRGVKKLLRLELGIAPVLEGERLARCGLLLVNPPHVLEAEARILLPALAAAFAQQAGSSLIEATASA